MATIILSYDGYCKGGPWDGQQIKAEFGFVRHDCLGGIYRWWKGEWLWCPRMGSANVVGQGPVK